VWQALGAASDEVEASEPGQMRARNESWSVSDGAINPGMTFLVSVVLRSAPAAGKTLPGNV
jgi:hypothetical protein